MDYVKNLSSITKHNETLVINCAKQKSIDRRRVPNF